MNNEEMLRVIMRQTLEAILKVMIFLVNIRKGQNQMKKLFYI